MNFTRNLLLKLRPICASGRHLLLDISCSSSQPAPNRFLHISSQFRYVVDSKQLFSENIKVLQKKRNIRKRLNEDEDLKAAGYYPVTAFSTAEEYDLESLLAGLQKEDLYAAKRFFATDNLGAEQDVLYVMAKYQVDEEPREIFFFREGSVVLWNCNDLESRNVLKFIRQYERDSYKPAIVRGESEVMPYGYVADGEAARFQDEKFFISRDEENYLEKYTFSNALITSVKLGVWEAILDDYIDSMAYITEDLKRGSKIRITRGTLLRKTGELFALRHQINLSSDLLDTPDFYWDREQLEKLYLQVCSYLSISRRTKVMNEKLNHCVELAELVSHELNDAHHIRLEWMIIILIMVEVCFEFIHYAERYLSNHQDESEEETSQGRSNVDGRR